MFRLKRPLNSEKAKNLADKVVSLANMMKSEKMEVDGMAGIISHSAVVLESGGKKHLIEQLGPDDDYVVKVRPVDLSLRPDGKLGVENFVISGEPKTCRAGMNWGDAKDAMDRAVGDKKFGYIPILRDCHVAARAAERECTGKKSASFVGGFVSDVKSKDDTSSVGINIRGGIEHLYRGDRSTVGGISFTSDKQEANMIGEDSSGTLEAVDLGSDSSFTEDYFLFLFLLEMVFKDREMSPSFSLDPFVSELDGKAKLKKNWYPSGNTAAILSATEMGKNMFDVDYELKKWALGELPESMAELGVKPADTDKLSDEEAETARIWVVPDKPCLVTEESGKRTSFLVEKVNFRVMCQRMESYLPIPSNNINNAPKAKDMSDGCPSWLEGFVASVNAVIPILIDREEKWKRLATSFRALSCARFSLQRVDDSSFDWDEIASIVAQSLSKPEESEHAELEGVGRWKRLRGGVTLLHNGDVDVALTLKRRKNSLHRIFSNIDDGKKVEKYNTGAGEFSIVTIEIEVRKIAARPPFTFSNGAFLRLPWKVTVHSFTTNLKDINDALAEGRFSGPSSRIRFQANEQTIRSTEMFSSAHSIEWGFNGEAIDPNGFIVKGGEVFHLCMTMEEGATAGINTGFP